MVAQTHGVRDLGCGRGLCCLLPSPLLHPGRVLACVRLRLLLGWWLHRLDDLHLIVALLVAHSERLIGVVRSLCVEVDRIQRIVRIEDTESGFARQRLVEGETDIVRVQDIFC